MKTRPFQRQTMTGLALCTRMAHSILHCLLLTSKQRYEVLLLSSKCQHKGVYSQMDQQSFEPHNKFQLSSRITSHTIPSFQVLPFSWVQDLLNVETMKDFTISKRPLTLTLKLVSSNMSRRTGVWTTMASIPKRPPPSRPSCPSAVGPGAATAATTKYKYVIFTVPIIQHSK